LTKHLSNKRSGYTFRKGGAGMYSYRYKDGYINYNRDNNKIYFTHELSGDTENPHEIKCDEKVQVKVKNRNIDDIKNVQITFISTPSCNLNCKYCYEHTNLSESGLKMMTAEQHFEIYKAVYDYYPKAEMRICFRGGEPFLAKQPIFKFVEMLKEHCKKEGIKMPVLGAITNGTLLDADARQYIHDNFDKITFSLDGTKILHDSNRIYKNGQGSFNDVVDKINEFNNLNKDRRISTACELTITDAYVENYNATEIKEVLSLLKELKFDAVEFIPVIDDNAKLINKSENLDSLAKDLVENWYNDILNNNHAIKVLSLVNYLAMFVKDKSFENMICEAGHGYFAVDSSYNVYPCQVSAFQDKNVIAKVVDSKLEFNENREIKYIPKKEHPLCKDCECLKGCASYCKIAMSSIKDNMPNSCLFHKAIFKNSLLKVVEIIQNEDKPKLIKGLKNAFKNGDLAHEGLR
jgi:uncharacterized protein